MQWSVYHQDDIPQVDIESLFSVFDTPAPVIETYVSRVCSNCGAEDTVLDSVCTSCGLCASHFINDECEWTSGLSGDGVVHDPLTYWYAL